MYCLCKRKLQIYICVWISYLLEYRTSFSLTFYAYWYRRFNWVTWFFFFLIYNLKSWGGHLIITHKVEHTRFQAFTASLCSYGMLCRKVHNWILTFQYADWPHIQRASSPKRLDCFTIESGTYRISWNLSS